MSSKPDSMLAIAIWTWDDGSARLCEAVALEDRAAEHDLEELLDGGSERCAAADDETQAAAETLLDSAEHDVIQQRRRLCSDRWRVMLR
jgi:hypothetical protein